MFKTLEEAKELRNKVLGFDPENEKECLKAVKKMERIYSMWKIRHLKFA